MSSCGYLYSVGVEGAIRTGGTLKDSDGCLFTNLLFLLPRSTTFLVVLWADQFQFYQLLAIVEQVAHGWTPSKIPRSSLLRRTSF